MARVKTGIIRRQRHKRVIKKAKGYYGRKSTNFRTAKEAVMKAQAHSFVGRKHRKRDFRKLWIARINAGARMNGTTYSKMIAGLKQADVTINRKMLADMAVNDKEGFTKLVEISKNINAK